MSERDQIAEVFGLTGGELADAPWIVTEPGDPVREWRFSYWYEGVPDYLDRTDAITAVSDECRTVCRDNMFGFPPQVVVDVDGTAWHRQTEFMTSGETECPMRGETAVEVCSLCDAGVGEEHGYIYIGDGWAEVVYRSDVAEYPPDTITS